VGAGFGRFGGNIASQYYSPLYYKYGLNTIYGLEKNGKYLNDTFWPCIFGETGILGTIFYILLLGDLFFLSLNLLKKTFNSKLLSANSIFFIWTHLLFLAALIDSVAQPIFTKNPQFFLIFLVLGYANKLSSKKQTN